MSILQHHITRTQFWVRIFGYGIYGKNLRYHNLMFSEREGYTNTFKLFGWCFTYLKPYKL